MAHPAHLIATLKCSASASGTEDPDEVSRHVCRRLAAPLPRVHDAVTKTYLSGKLFKFVTQSAFDFLHCRNAMRLLCCHRAFANFADLAHDALQSSVWARLLLPAAVSPRPFSFFMDAAKELCEWASPISSEERMKPVSELSSDRWTAAGLRKTYPDDVIAMLEAKNERHLGSDIAVLLAGRSLSAAQFMCSDAVRQRIALLACRLPKHGEMERCTFTKHSDKISIKDEDGVHYCGAGSYEEAYDISLRIAVSRSRTVVMKLHAVFFRFWDFDGAYGEESHVKVTFNDSAQSVYSAANTESVLFSINSSEERWYAKSSIDTVAIWEASRALLGAIGDPQEGVVTLFVLWRLLCAPTIVWPRGHSQVGTVLGARTQAELHCNHTMLRLRAIFERVANAPSLSAIVYWGLSPPSVPWSDLDDPSKLDELAFSLAIDACDDEASARQENGGEEQCRRALGRCR